MNTVLAFDYDGVIANTNQVKSEWIARNLGQEVPPWQCDRTRCVPVIGLAAYERMSREVYGREASLGAQPMPGAIEGIRELAAMHRLVIVTARDEERMRWTREWLHSAGIERCFADIRSSVGGSKPDIVAGLGAAALVDDDARHLRGAPEARFARLLFLQGGEPGEVEPGIYAVPDWQTLIARLAGLG